MISKHPRGCSAKIYDHRAMRRFAALLIPLTLISAAPEPEPEPTSRGSTARVGMILAHGGGAPGMQYIRDFVDRCGKGTHLAIIPTATFSEGKTIPREDMERKWTKRGFGRVSVVHTHLAQAAVAPLFSVALDDADCVWISGGAQARLEAAYVGTPVPAKVARVVERGGVVAGYSAGATILTDVMIRRGEDEPEDGHGFALLPGVIIDQHFVAKHRKPRLMAMLARHPELVGYGIDERTALKIEGDRFEVIGSSVVMECRHATGCKRLTAGTTGVLGE